MSALGRVVRAGVGRRRVQTVVIGLVVMIAVSTSVLGGTLLVASHAPFDRAFAQQNGAHLTAEFDPARTTTAQLAATARVGGVAAAAGPFRTVSIDPVDENDRPMSPLTVVGRTQPGGGAVDAVTLTEGRWATRPGELVVFRDGRRPPDELAVGTVWHLPDLSGSPTLTIVGVARSVSGTADGWVAPEQVAALTAPGDTGGLQMLYRLAEAGTAAQVDAGRAAVAAALPAGALTASRSWLTTRQDGSSGDTALFVPFLIAFGVLGLVMAVLIIGNVIAGAVSMGTRRIGILKALGFTPGQVVRAYVGQALIPALTGAVLGVLVGNAISIPVLALTNDVYGTSDAGVAPGVDAGVLAGVLALVGGSAWVAASRAGRLRTVDALAAGRTPAAGRGQWAARLAARIPLPRPVTLGLAHPFARPVRSATIVAAIAFGAAAVTFSFGLAASLAEAQATISKGDVVIGPGVPQRAPGTGRVKAEREPSVPVVAHRSAQDTAAIVGAITAQAGTAGYCGTAPAEVTVAGLTSALQILGTSGDDCPSGYRMVSGTWFGKPGEIVVATPFLTATQTRVGDTVVLTDHGTRITARIVGEAFNDDHGGMQILTAAGTLAAAEPDLQPQNFTVTVRAGTDPAAYAQALDTRIQQFDAHATTYNVGAPDVVIIINTLTTLLSLMLVAVAALGVLNTVVLETRERVHDLGIHKALGMAPRQTIAMVLASVTVAGLAGGALGTPIGVLLQRTIVTAMGAGTGYRLPASVLDVFGPVELVLFGLGGIVIAVLGALLPAGWAARTRTATALRTE